MNAAEFRCGREYLGLSTQWVAEKLQKNTRTISAWEEGKSPLPSYASEFMSAMLAAGEQTVGALTTRLPSMGDSIPVPFGDKVRDREHPPAYYRRIASRVAERTKMTIEYEKESAHE